jgi:hypothetical protein
MAGRRGNSLEDPERYRASMVDWEVVEESMEKALGA